MEVAHSGNMKRMVDQQLTVAKLLITGFLFTLTAGEKICTYNSQRFAVLFNNPPGPGKGIVAHALDCYQRFNGSIYEVRDVNVAKAILDTMISGGCLPDVRPGAGFITLYVAPQSWDSMRVMKANSTQSTWEVPQFWKYADGTSMSSSMFSPGEPNNWDGGEEWCIHLRNKTHLLNDCPCFLANTAALCHLDGSESAKSCRALPPNPTKNYDTPAVVVPLTGSTAAQPPYPVSTTAAFNCPCGYEWNSSARSAALIKTNSPWPGNRTSLNVTCLGSLGWTTFDITSCVISNWTAVGIQSGKARLITDSFQGNHSDAARKCAMSAGGSLPWLNNSTDDLQKVSGLLLYHPCVQGDIPLAQNILLMLTPTIARNKTAFIQLWRTVVVDDGLWHPQEPSYDSTDPAGCSVLTQRDGIWKFAAKRCSVISSATAYLCLTQSSAGGASSKSCATADLLQQKPGTILRFSSGRSMNSENVSLGVDAIHRCPCGQIFSNMANVTTLSISSTCWGALGWIPSDIAECLGEPSSGQIVQNGLKYIFRSSTSSYGITDAAKSCFESTNNLGVLAEPVSADLVMRMAMLIKAQCFDSAFIAPTMWRDMRGSALNSNTTLTSSEAAKVWSSANGFALPADVQFSPNEPNNFGGQEQCLQIAVSLEDENSFGIQDVQCWNKSDGARHICAVPLLEGSPPVGITDCPSPDNPTDAQAIKAQIDYGIAGPSQEVYPFNSTVKFICPAGYAWAPVKLWPADLASTAVNTKSSMMRTDVSVTCLGTLGWTLFDVTECIDATVCGPLPPIPATAVQICNITSSGSAYTCLQVCANSTLVWRSGVSVRTLTCDSKSKNWTAPDDSCVPRTCNASKLWNNNTVNWQWNGNTSIGAYANYYCPQDQAFDGKAQNEQISMKSTCNPDGRWSNVTQLPCLPIRCNRTAIPNFPGVLREWNGNATIGANTTYFCPQDQAFDGKASLENTTLPSTCLSNGSWSSLSRLVCSPIRCNRTAVLYVFK